MRFELFCPSITFGLYYIISLDPLAQRLRASTRAAHLIEVSNEEIQFLTLSRPKTLLK